jgi:hypothetical protein
MISISYKALGLAAFAAVTLVMASGLAEGRAGSAKGTRLYPSPIIERAFGALPPRPHIRQGLTASSKGDRIVTRECDEQIWPQIDYRCLTTHDSSMPRRPARTVTVERARTGASSTHHRSPVSRTVLR